MNIVTCPACHEANPPEVVKCLACFETFRQDVRLARLPQDNRSPIERVADLILNYAVKDNASAIRIMRAVEVEYQIAGEWQLKVKAPGLIWSELQAEFVTRANHGTLRGEHEGCTRSFSLRSRSGDSLFFSIQ